MFRKKLTCFLPNVLNVLLNVSNRPVALVIDRIRRKSPTVFIKSFCYHSTDIIKKEQIKSEPNCRQKSFKMPLYELIEKGSPNSTNYSIYYRNSCGKLVSPFHDIPLYANKEKGIYNMIVEIPRWTNAKMEISTKIPLNPIKQDVKKGRLRFVANCFPHKGYIWNYGAFPQTWENPHHVEPTTGCKGDNDPLDVLEIGYRVAKRGEVIQVKVLGIIGLIDEGETDWKVIVINVKDPLADQIKNSEDIEMYCPGLLRATIEWLRIYKVPDGKPENQFAYNGEIRSVHFATNKIKETHYFWRDIVKAKLEGSKITCANTTLENSPCYIDEKQAEKILDEAPDGGDVEEIPDLVDTWHFVHLK